MQMLTEPFPFDALAEAFTPEDRRPAVEWATDFIQIPNSARSCPKFSASATPWLIDPINAVADNSNREIVVLMPTGAGKTTIFDVSVPRAIATDPGSILFTQQTDKEAEDYWDERLEPILRGVDSVRWMIDEVPRNKKSKGTIKFPHLTLYVTSAKISALQRKSVRWVLIDEAWKVKHGFIEEARARTHDRWDRRVVIVSQGGCTFIERDGEIVKTELEEAHDQTDKKEYKMVCPDCGHVQRWKQASMVCEYGGHTSKLDDLAILQSTRYKCEGRCSIEFQDRFDVRRQLSTESIYQVTNPNHKPGHVGFHCPAMALYYIEWGELQLQWIKANRAKHLGDYEPLKIYIQKRLAEFWNEYEIKSGPATETPVSDYVIHEYPVRFPYISSGFPWSEEYQRFLAGDVQEKGGRYFVGGAAAFTKEGKSRVLWSGRLETWEEIRAKQEELGIVGMRVGIDCAHDTPEVDAACRKYGWIELLGSDERTWSHPDPVVRGQMIQLPWSTPKQIRLGLGTKNYGRGGHCYRFYWSNDYFHDLHNQRLSGKGLYYGVPADIEDSATYTHPDDGKPTGFWAQMRANQRIMKTTEAGDRKPKWVRIGNRPDHYRDVRCQLLVLAGIAGCLGSDFTTTP
jgi:hypothetical protein